MQARVPFELQGASMHVSVMQPTHAVGKSHTATHWAWALQFGFPVGYLISKQEDKAACMGS